MVPFQSEQSSNTSQKARRIALALTSVSDGRGSQYVTIPPFVSRSSFAHTAVRRAVWEVNKDQALGQFQALRRVIDASVAPQRFNTLLLTAFGVIALALAAVGIYGVIGYSVAQRTREIGIRIALGAQKGNVLSLVIGQGMRLALMGVSLGVAAALALTRVMTSLLYEVEPTDPLTFAGVSLLLVAIALFA